jgi:glycosyltransferase involved in cell wall biosynthesis
VLESDRTGGDRSPRDARALRIAQLGSTRYRGGVTQAVTALCLALRKRGHAVMLVSDGGELEPLADAGVECVATDLQPRPSVVIRSAFHLARALRAFRPDVVHVHGRSVALRSYLAGRAPDWFTLHNTHLTERRGRLDAGVGRRLLSPLGRRLLVLDDRARDYLERELGVAASRIFTLSHGVDCDHFRPPTGAERHEARAAFGVSHDETLVLFVGRLHAQKQPQVVVQAARAARDAGLRMVRFAIVGEGELRESLVELIGAAGVARTCTLRGWMDARAAYFAADLLVMPSRYEGFGLVAAEAMATGCPVLRTRTGGVERMIVDGETGFTAGTEPEEFIATLLRVLRDTPRLARMRPAARAWAASKLDADTSVDELVRQYRRHLSSR